MHDQLIGFQVAMSLQPVTDDLADGRGSGLEIGILGHESVKGVDLGSFQSNAELLCIDRRPTP